MTSGGSLIQLLHVSKSYDASSIALQDVSLSVGAGEFLCITGQGGSGKSTLLKIMCGMEEPTEGHIVIDGAAYSRIPKRMVPLIRRRIGLLFQDFLLLNNKSVYENVALSLKVTGVTRTEIKTRVTEILDYLKLGNRAGDRPRSLSTGEQQRVALARALVKRPEMILADEPTGNLDADAAAEMVGFLKVVNESGIAVVLCTHDKGLLRLPPARTLVLDRGRLVE